MDTTPAHKHPQPLGERLDSWKEIAAYLKRDIRTVQRWEKHEGLPVHRHLHDERGTAYAYRGEIDEWLQTRSRHENEVPADGHSTVSGHAPDASSTSSGRSPRRLFLYVALAAALVAVIVTWALSRSSPAAVAPLSSLSIVFAPSERFHDWGPDFALSPDGSTLVYAGLGGRLHLRRIDELSARGLEGTDGSWGPFFSPDGRWIGFNHGGHLKKVSVAAGTPVPLGVAVGFMGAADWGPDDNIVYAAITPEGTSGLYRLPANGSGVPQLVAALDANSDETYWLTPQSVSNGKYILATLARSAASGSRFQIVAVSVATGARRILVDDARHAQYVGDGILVYWRNNALFATRLDADRIEVIGSHVPAWDDVFERVRLRSWASAAGVLVYWPNLRVSHRLVWVDRAGKQEPLPLPPAMYHAPRISPDGQRIAYSVGTEPDSDVWTYDLSTGVTARLTSGGRSASPLWTPDGTGLIISSRGAVGRDLAFLRVNGTAKPEPIPFPSTFLRGASKLPASWADGGRTLIVRQYDLEGQPPLWGFALDDGSNPRPIRPDSANHGRISPDGRWLAYNVSAYRRTDYRSAEVYVTDFPAAGPQWKVSTGGGVLPVWSRNGRELFYREGPRMMAVSVTPGETFAPGTARPLFEVPYFEADPGMPNYDVAPDGQRFVMVFPASTEGPDRLNVIQGWKTEILRRLGDSR